MCSQLVDSCVAAVASSADIDGRDNKAEQDQAAGFGDGGNLYLIEKCGVVVEDIVIGIRFISLKQKLVRASCCREIYRPLRECHSRLRFIGADRRSSKKDSEGQYAPSPDGPERPAR